MVAVVNPADHMRLVYSIAGKYKFRGEDFQDIVQEGALGVMHAARKFDPKRGVKFSTYAVHCIRAYIQRHLLDKCRQIRILSHKHAALKKSGEVPPAPASLDKPLRVGGGTRGEQSRDGIFTLHDVLADRTTERADDAALRRNEEAHLDDALQTLKPKPRYVLQRRFFDERTLEEIGGELGVTRERIRQIEEKALQQLREYFDEFVY